MQPTHIVEFSELEYQVDHLLRSLECLRIENNILRQKLASNAHEQSLLVEKIFMQLRKSKNNHTITGRNTMNDIVQSIISVKILDRNYKIKCPFEQAQALQEAANYVDEQIRKVRQSVSISSTEHITIVAAVNICYEFIQLRKQKIIILML